MEKTKIPISKLSIGMLVTGVDRPWYATPFLSHRMMITTEAEIATLKACGVKLVEIETAGLPDHQRADAPPPASAQSVEDPPAVATGEPEKGAGQDSASAEPSLVSTSVMKDATPALPLGEPEAEVNEQAQASPPVAALSFEEELQTAYREYEQAKTAVRDALEQAKMGRAFDQAVVRRVVGALAGSILRNTMALASLSRLKSVDQYSYCHAVNTSVLAMTLGHSLGMGRDTLETLGMGVLLHDIGKTQLPADLFTKAGALKPEDRELAKQHVLRGVEFLTHVAKLSGDVLLPVLEHHERMDGSGYPFGRKRHELSEFGLIAGVVDMYDALTSDRPYRAAVNPHQALQMLYEMSRRTILDTALVERFIRCMGIYPVGSCVRLSTGEVGVVAKINPTQTLAPVVLVVRHPARGGLTTPQPLDLAQQSSKPVKRITEVISPAEVGVVPNDVLDHAHMGSPLRQAA